MALFVPSLKVTVLMPPVVAGTGNDPAPAPSLEIVVLPTSTALPPGRFQVMVTVALGVKFESEKPTFELTVPRFAESEPLAGPGIETLIVPVWAAAVGLSPRILFAPALALFGTTT